MKKVKIVLSILAIVVLAMSSNPVMAQSRKDKKAAKKAEWEYEQQMLELKRQKSLDSLKHAMEAPSEVFVEIPCYEASRSDKSYYRELGTGKDVEMAKARKKAVQSAQSIMKERLAHTVKGLATDYSKTVSVPNKGMDMENMLENEFVSVVDAALNDADNPCEKWSQDRTGNWNAYYTIEIKKTELVDKLANAVSKNEELKVAFDREQFRKFAEDYMQKLEASKSE
ncbi:MAG: hypothetical protein MJZ86_08335 [Bacteroidales bacterium]|nr:hypothetical protein [Bacteroidales bacterium]